MTEIGAHTIIREKCLAQRLARLFKIERDGGFDRRSVETVQRLIKRRDAIVEELLSLDGMRRSLGLLHSAELEQALQQLAREVNFSSCFAEMKLDRLGRDLRARSGEGLPTGIRDSANGRLLGKS
jgi:hypothetical protein